MPAELLTDIVANCLKALKADRRLFERGMEETAKAVARSHELIAESREALVRAATVKLPLDLLKMPSRPTNLQPPVCVGCQLPMRYVVSQLDAAHALIRHVLFACDCGRTSCQAVVAET